MMAVLWLWTYGGVTGKTHIEEKLTSPEEEEQPVAAHAEFL